MAWAVLCALADVPWYCVVWSWQQEQTEPRDWAVLVVDGVRIGGPPAGMQQDQAADTGHRNACGFLSVAGDGVFGIVHTERWLQSDGAVGQ